MFLIIFRTHSFWLPEAIDKFFCLQLENSLCQMACVSHLRYYTTRIISFYLLPHSFMSKQDLITNIANAAGITKRAAGSALEAMTGMITKELKRGNRVTITGFGTFRVSKRAARMGVNPRNPVQKISIPAMKVPSFKAGKTLKDAVR